MYQDVISYIQNIKDEVLDISEERKDKLTQLAEYIRSKKELGERAKLTFICTHNSRRSHFCQIWAATLAHHFGLENIRSFSGGTEVTAFNSRAVDALERAGFRIENPGGKNPHYRVRYDDNLGLLICFSKTFDDPANPQKDFSAIMTCSDADQNCPVVPGASTRFAIPYIDPKEADGTPKEEETYDERCQQIASEIYFMLSQV